MNFVSYQFLILLAIVLSVLPWLRQRACNGVLLCASLVFYGVWDIRFLALLASSIVIDFIGGQAMDGKRLPFKTVAALTFIPALWLAVCRYLIAIDFPSTPIYVATLAALTYIIAYQALWKVQERKRAKAFLIFSIAFNLSILGFFKYFNFFILSLKAVFNTGFHPWPILLPIGISFYTFQSIAYIADVYKKKIAASHDLLEFATFVSFFPQLVAGPIERAGHMLPQIRQQRSLSLPQFAAGSLLILYGFFKKIVLADNLGYIVDQLSHSLEPVNLWLTLLIGYTFAFQIYYDFSGYTDIARGTARMLGFHLSLNFRFPYFATSPSDFWQRWHISLSSWFRDYLYIPLGGNRNGPVRTFINLMIVMLLGGLWHGASWNFVLWGGYNGLLLVIFHLLTPGLHQPQGPSRYFWLKAFAYFQLTCIGWLFFRTPENLVHAFSWQPLSLISIQLIDSDSYAAFMHCAALVSPMLLFEIYQFRISDDEPWLRWQVPFQMIFILVLFYAIIFIVPPSRLPFIYFRF